MNAKRHLTLLLACLLLCCGLVPALQAQESRCPADSPLDGKDTAAAVSLLTDKACWMQHLADTVVACPIVLPIYLRNWRPAYVPSISVCVSTRGSWASTTATLSSASIGRVMYCLP